jgi:hypothetical protein
MTALQGTDARTVFAIPHPRPAEIPRLLVLSELPKVYTGNQSLLFSGRYQVLSRL